MSGLFCEPLPGSLEHVLGLFLPLADLLYLFFQPVFLLVSALDPLLQPCHLGPKNVNFDIRFPLR